MIVGKIILSGGNRPMRFDSMSQGLLYAAMGDCNRIAFAGKTARGRSGIALNISRGHITGHKIDPMPARLPRLVRHVPSSAARDGLQLAANGEDVLIGTAKNGVVLKWVGTDIEVFGAGDDSHS